jgi:hypothetical protein
MSLFFFFFFFFFFFNDLFFTRYCMVQYFSFQLLIRYLPFRSSKHQKVLVQAFPLVENTLGPLFWQQ